MVTIEYWIQLENHPWDACPNHIDRMTSEQFAPVPRTLKSPATNANQVQRAQNMFRPLQEDALILRRYKPPQQANQNDAWTVPDDRKVNPWDLNEPDPTDAGTMGTIPGPVIECNVGDSVKVHFRNMDTRTRPVVHPAVTHQEWRVVWTTRKILGFDIPFPTFEQVTVVDVPESTTQEPLPIEKRLHSLHSHGFVFDARFDGAYPLSPADPAQPVAGPPGPDETAAWANVPQFAAAAAKKGDRVPPAGTFIYEWRTIGWPTTAGVWLYHDHSICDMDNVNLGAIGIVVIHNPNDVAAGRDVDIRLPALQQDPTNTSLDPQFLPPGPDPKNGSPIDRTNPAAPVYRTPQIKALYLQLYHTLTGAPGMCINGRTFLGNTPTLVGNPNTLMRFGIVGMGSEFHTFHIHGHRWVIPGPTGANALDFGADMNSPVSQFEDTKIFGPANSFAFTIKEGTTFMRAEPPVGEWHMHCHVLDHMMTGMMGSLLIVGEGDPVPQNGLPQGVPCPKTMPDGGGMPGMGGGTPMTATVRSAGSGTTLRWVDDVSGTPETTVKVGGTVSWDGTVSPPHTVASVGSPGFAGVAALPGSFTFSTVGDYKYQCGVHGGDPVARTGMWGIVHVVP